MRGLLLGCLVAFTAMCEANSSDWRCFRISFYDDTVTGPLYHVNYVDKDGWWWLGLDLTIQCTLVGDGNGSSHIYDLTFDLGAASTQQSWISANQGDVVSAMTMHGLSDDQYLARYDSQSGGHIGQTHLMLESSELIYLAFSTEGYDYYPPPPYVYGWIGLEVDTYGNPTIVGSNLDPAGGPMVVGGGAYTGGIPEPSGGVLMLLGLAALGLRRRAFPVPSP